MPLSTGLDRKPTGTSPGCPTWDNAESLPDSDSAGVDVGKSIRRWSTAATDATLYDGPARGFRLHRNGIEAINLRRVDLAQPLGRFGVPYGRAVALHQRDREPASARRNPPAIAPGRTSSAVTNVHRKAPDFSPGDIRRRA